MFSELIKCEEKYNDFQLERGYAALWTNELWQNPYCSCYESKTGIISKGKKKKKNHLKELHRKQRKKQPISYSAVMPNYFGTQVLYTYIILEGCYLLFEKVENVFSIFQTLLKGAYAVM